MNKIHTLGPKGTYSEIASYEFIKKLKNKYEIMLHPSIDHVFNNLKDNDLLVLPFENRVDGYIQRTIDLIHQNNLFINSIFSLNISFSFISDEKEIDDIKNIYVQFKAKNQVLNFLSQYNGFNYIITESNSESLNLYLKNKENSAAIIPFHLVSDNYNIIINHIEDIKENITKFVLVSNELKLNDYNKLLKVFISLIPNDDKPGLLYDLLSDFKKLNINLSAIISRPRKDLINKYYFYLELDTYLKDFNNLKIILKNNKSLKTKILGVYYELS